MGLGGVRRSTPPKLNSSWVALKQQYQGIAPPVARSEADFDPGAKFHIPGNTPYARYFLARLLQFQFYKSACDMAGWKGPLHRCSFYGNKQVGARLNSMLATGASKPWPDALEPSAVAWIRASRCSNIRAAVGVAAKQNAAAMRW